MSKKVIKAIDYSPSEKDNLFFDTNIWLNLFTPTGNFGNATRIKQVNSFYKKILENSINLYTSSLVISEFFNSYCRIIFNLKKEQEPDKYIDYKRDFRSTEEYIKLSDDIISIVNDEILSVSNKLDDCFSSINLEDMLIAKEAYDYNDNYICQLCSLNNIKVVTADKDFVLSPLLKTDLILVD